MPLALTATLTSIALAGLAPSVALLSQGASCSASSNVNTLLNLATIVIVGYVIQVTKKLDKEVRNGGE
jgi:hypothetical protein